MESSHNNELIEETPAAPRPSRPLLIVVSAPSGAGKSTLCNRLVNEFPNITYSVSCTTRDPRGEEKDGQHYYFLSKKEFKERIKNGEFLEHAKVHGNFYGTLEDTVLYAMEQGSHILLLKIPQKSRGRTLHQLAHMASRTKHKIHAQGRQK